MHKLRPILSYFLMCSGLFPAIFCLLYFFYARIDQQELREKLNSLTMHTTLVEKTKLEEDKRLEKLKTADPAYLEKVLAGLVFLEAEIKRLQLVKTDPNVKRLRFFKERANSLQFIEENFRENLPFQETDIRLDHPVEMDSEDLKKLLKGIEEIEAPELVIKKFELSRKSPSPQEEVYLINFELIKRELLHAKSY